MDDTISRKAAIDAAIKADMENHNGILSEKRARVFEEHISILPPVQPTITHEQAIDYLHKTGWLQEHDRILTESKIVPPVQPKRGKWTWDRDTLDWEHRCYCSECKKYALNDTHGKQVLSDFCPSCNADMRGEEK